MNLTFDNYYSPEADMEYMSCSQYQGFLECEAKQLAKIQSRWREEPSEAFIVGNYFHTYFESPEAHIQFCDSHSMDIYKTRTDKKTGEVKFTGEKYAAYAKADIMIDAVRKDKFIQLFIDMPGQNEVIMTGTLFGVPWRIRIDKYAPDYNGNRFIIDWKTAANIYETKYNPATKEHETFIDYYGYSMRAAVYSEIEKQSTGNETAAQFIIIAVSKQDYPDKEVLSLNHRDKWDLELEKIKQKIFNIQRLKKGEMLPLRCGLCDYCRATKQLKKIREFWTLAPQFREEREEDDYINREKLFF